MILPRACRTRRRSRTFAPASAGGEPAARSPAIPRRRQRRTQRCSAGFDPLATFTDHTAAAVRPSHADNTACASRSRSAPGFFALVAADLQELVRETDDAVSIGAGMKIALTSN